LAVVQDVALEAEAERLGMTAASAAAPLRTRSPMTATVDATAYGSPALEAADPRTAAYPVTRRVAPRATTRTGLPRSGMVGSPLQPMPRAILRSRPGGVGASSVPNSPRAPGRSIAGCPPRRARSSV